MAIQKYKVGDRVQLNVGGPVMTVKDVFESFYRCQWFAGRKLDQGIFEHDCLVPVLEEAEKK